MFGYFSAQALTGERGLLNGTERHQELAARRAELAELEATRTELRARVDGLSPEHLSVDMLEERARVVLVITGLPRPAEAADRGDRRGAIRAKLIDWLAAGPHASRIAAVRNAHRRHGGAGAVYVVLKRSK